MEDFLHSSMTFATLMVSPQTMTKIAHRLGCQDVPEAAPKSMKEKSEHYSAVVGAIVRHLTYNGIQSSGDGAQVRMYPRTVRMFSATPYALAFPYYAWTKPPICQLEEHRHSGKCEDIGVFVNEMEDPIQTELGGFTFANLCVFILEWLPADLPVIQLYHAGESQIPPFATMSEQIKNRATLMREIALGAKTYARLQGIPVLNARTYELLPFLNSLSSFVPPLDKRPEGTCKYFKDGTGRNFGIPPMPPLQETEEARKDDNSLWSFPPESVCGFCEKPIWGLYYVNPMYEKSSELIFCADCGDRVRNTQVLLVVDSGRTQEHVFETLRGLLQTKLPEFIHFTAEDLDVVEAATRGVEEIQTLIRDVKYYLLGRPGEPEFLGIDGKLERLLFHGDVHTVRPDLRHVRFVSTQP